MGTAVSKKRNLRNDAISSVAAKVSSDHQSRPVIGPVKQGSTGKRLFVYFRLAARAFGEYLSHTHPENLNGSAHLLCETLVDPDPELPSDTIGPNNNNHLHPCSNTTKGCEDNPESNVVKPSLGLVQPPPPCITISTKPSRLSLERSFSAEEDQQKCVECTLQPARVYTITTQRGMLMSSGRGSKESLELDVLKEKSGSRGVGSRGGLIQPSTSPSSTSSSPTQYHHASSGRGTSDHHSNHRHGHHHGASGTNAPSSSGAHNIRSWGEGGKGEAECSGLACDSCSTAPSRSQGSLDLESASREAGKQHRRLERMWSVDRMTGLERGLSGDLGKEKGERGSRILQKSSRAMSDRIKPKSHNVALESVQNDSSFSKGSTHWMPQFLLCQPKNFRKHLRMVGSRRIKAQSGDLQASCGTLDEGGVDDNLDWEEEREMERLACEGDDFVPPKIMLISSKVPKAEYVPTIIRRDDPSIIPILYDHEHATFDDILEEIEKKLTAYRRGSKFWRMLIFCQGGPGHLYLLKNKVATFAKVEKEEDMSQFWRRLSRFMSKINPEPNLIHIMGCYVLGNPNGEKLFQKLKNLMRPYSVEFESPLELSAQVLDPSTQYKQSYLLSSRRGGRGMAGQGLSEIWCASAPPHSQSHVVSPCQQHQLLSPTPRNQTLLMAAKRASVTSHFIGQ
ncbi:NMDA receptor synaptonuclear signaling and neuronal migration factor [Collichthys lucidus]|uniref:NMDA receptor synaptonuclear signaling and neuronal migration factor n=1 Tax=Collichthys lucidus TaxID=240159 RepID=A0A4U5VAU4_COLLU|nr:NMDA receptor synaptonuclear signaling and neuronal migration factor [Collichthys lucidus]